jgi:hypothetical protein
MDNSNFPPLGETHIPTTSSKSSASASDSEKRKARTLFEAKLFRMTPTEISTENEEEVVRNVFCPFYSTCLLFVILHHETWHSFTCSSCPHLLNDEGKHDIEPSEILRTNYFIKNHENFRLSNLNFSELKTITQGSNEQPITYINKTKLPPRKEN